MVNKGQWVTVKAYDRIYNDGRLFSHEKEGNPVICTIWIELKDIMLSEVSRAEEDKYCMFSLT